MDMSYAKMTEVDGIKKRVGDAGDELGNPSDDMMLSEKRDKAVHRNEDGRP